jgi:PelA/Pel-15E family pectate lyase
VSGPLGYGNPWDTVPTGPEPAAIDVSAFHDATHHWRDIKDERIVEPEPGQGSYSPDQVHAIATNVLLFQRKNGGWPKDFDMLAVLTRGQKRAVWASRVALDTSFDNETTHSQTEYLARAHAATGNPKYRAACERGLDFMLSAQYPNGGFPQNWPHPQSYRAHITFNDGVMVGILNVLRAAAQGEPAWAWLDAKRRERARQAVARGVDCILKCQTRVAGNLTGWGQQHNERTLLPAPARSFEVVSLSPQDTTDIVRFLMKEPPTPALTSSIEAAVAWLGTTALSGIRVDEVPAPHAVYERHETDVDVVVVPDPNAKKIWARFYELGSNRPIFADRDGVPVYSLAEVDRERRTGSTWFGTWPAKLLGSDYPDWQRRLTGEGASKTD